ncbi:MAG: ABC transporter permease [Candidatus Pacearchaeota archaeon]|jgi:putative ABC transport system permease protein
MIYDYFNLAFKNLKHRGARSWLTLLGIFIGVMAVVALISLGNALKIGVTSQFGVGSTEVISVQAGGVSAFGPPGSTATIPLTKDDVGAISKVSGVKRAIGRNVPAGKLEFNDKVVFGYALNVPDGDDRKFVYEEGTFEAEVGRLLKDGDVNKVVLGYNFYADKVGLEKSIKPGDSILLQDKKFEVVGILKKEGSLIYDNIVLVNEKPLEELMGYGDEVDLIVVQVNDKDEIDLVKERIEKELRNRRDVKEGEENFQVSTPESTLENVNSILNGVQAFVVIIALISIIVGAIGIINTMTTSVLERKKEIGVMKSIGATNFQIFMQFFIESSLLGLVGGIVGVTFGILVGVGGTLGLSSWLGTTIKPAISFGLIFFTLLTSFLIGGISGIYPAMKAANENPVEALRG